MRKHRLLIFGIILVTSCVAAATDTKEIAKTIKSSIQGKTFLLRGLPADKKLTFDSNLALISEVHPGTWASAVFAIQNVQSKKNDIKIIGFCPPMDVAEGNAPHGIEIEVKGPFTLSAGEILQVLKSKVLVTDTAEADALVPKPWSDVLAGRIDIGKGAPIAGFLPSGQPIYRLKAGMKLAKPIFSPDPMYSEEARKAKYQGVTVLAVVIDDMGKVVAAHVARAIGKGLDENAIEAVRHWTFQPAELNGKPVPVAINIEVSFNLY